jgi:fructose/tagatose bisphosphate aldolase
MGKGRVDPLGLIAAAKAGGYAVGAFNMHNPETTQALIRAGQNSPTVQNGALTFDRGLKQFMNFGPQTLRLSVGFTAVFKVAWNG